MVAYDSEGIALGLVGQKSWTRQTISKDTPAEKSTKRRKTPIEEKESYRWLEGLQMAKQAAQACPLGVVLVKRGLPSLRFARRRFK